MKELIEIQSELKAPKNQYNSFGKYHYRSCEDILESVKPLLKKHNCQLLLTDTIEAVGNRIYVKATARLSNSSEAIEVSAYAREEDTKKGMDSSQITGAASSYARKYALNGLFLIDDTRDSDATNTGVTQDKKSEKPATKLSFEEFKKELEIPDSRDGFRELYKKYRSIETKDNQLLKAISAKMADLNI